MPGWMKNEKPSTHWRRITPKGAGLSSVVLRALCVSVVEISLKYLSFTTETQRTQRATELITFYFRKRNLLGPMFKGYSYLFSGHLVEREGVHGVALVLPERRLA